MLVSAASAWEIATKHRLGRLPSVGAVFVADVAGVIASQGFGEVAISVSDATRAGSLPGPLRDPFDRLLIAQALNYDWTLVSIEDLFNSYGVRRLW